MSGRGANGVRLLVGGPEAWVGTSIALLDHHGNFDHGTRSRDSYGNLEPDKMAEAGLAFLKHYAYGRQLRYLDTAITCADVLAMMADVDHRRSDPVEAVANTE
jgi:hypothetical protein